MAKYVLKAGAIEARQHQGPQSIIVNSNKKGEQTVRPGAFLIEDGEAIDKARADFDARKKAFDDGDSTVDPGEFLKPKGSVYSMTAEEFNKTYELESGEQEDGGEGLYNVPHFEKKEAAMHAAGQQTAATNPGPFRCTIGDDANLYSIAKDGTITQVPVVKPNATDDVGNTFEPGARDERIPVSLQNAQVHETLPANTDQAQGGMAQQDA